MFYAFNSVRRDKMLTAVRDLVPTLFPFIHSVYSSPSLLFWGDKIIQSSEGVQQGDPLGSLLFCLSIHHVVCHLKSELCIGYIDDITVGGTLEDVQHDVAFIEREAGELGLVLNHKKSEIITNDPSSRSSVLSQMPDALVVEPQSATLLGSPLGNVESISILCPFVTTQPSCRSWERGSNTFVLMTASYCSVMHLQLMHLIRTSPCFLSPSLHLYDNELDTFAPSHLSMTASEVCAAANQAEQTKIKKYSYITSHMYHSFTPVAFETIGVCNPHSMSFLTDLGRRVVNTTGDKSSLAKVFSGHSEGECCICFGNFASHPLPSFE